MDVLPPDAVEAIVSAMLMRNIHVALGTMIYCSEELMCVMMDNIASFRPSDLSVLPPEIINMRFRKDYSRYLERSINEHLPADIRRKLESLHGIHEQFAAVFTQILEIRNTDLPESSKRNFILEIVFEIMKRIDPGLHEFLLLELTHKGYLNTEDLYILRSFQTAVK